MGIDRRWPLAEESLHAEAIGWLTANREFRLVFEDPDEKTGARLDLIGMLEGQVCLAEVKVSCPPSTVPSLERKFASAFHGHGATDSHPMLEAMRSVWDGASVPLIAVIAENFSEKGLHDLKAMLEQRATEWQADVEIWEWTGNALRTLFRRHQEMRARSPDHKINVRPASRRKQGTRATKAHLVAIATANGVDNLFGIAFADAVDLGLKCDFRKDSVTLTYKRGTGWLRLLPSLSSREAGLMMDCVDEIHSRLVGMPIADHGKGIFGYSRIATRDQKAVREIVKIAVNEAPARY